METRIAAADNHELLKSFSKEECRCAIFQMHLDKALGSHGFNPGFFQKFWYVIGDDIFYYVLLG